MIQKILDIWPLVTSLLLMFSAVYLMYLMGQLTESRRQVGVMERARDRWKKRATDAEGAAGSLRYAYEDCKKQRKHVEEVLEAASRALRQRAIRLEVGADAPKPRQ